MGTILAPCGHLEVVRMRRAARISGLTTIRGRPSALANVMVLAFPRTRSLPLRLTRAELLGSHGVLSAETDAEGAFILEGATPPEHYDVVVGGLGWTSGGLTPATTSLR